MYFDKKNKGFIITLLLLHKKYITFLSSFNPTVKIKTYLSIVIFLLQTRVFL